MRSRGPARPQRSARTWRRWLLCAAALASAPKLGGAELVVYADAGRARPGEAAPAPGFSDAPSRVLQGLDEAADDSITSTPAPPLTRPPLTLTLTIPHLPGTQDNMSRWATAGGPCTALTNFTNTTGSPMATYTDGFKTWLRDAPYQAFIALMAVVLGFFCAWNGPAIWQLLFTGMTAFAAAGLAHVEGKASDLTSNAFSEALFVTQVSLAAGLAVHNGFEGSQVLLGVAMGFFGAYGIGGWARWLDESIPGVAIIWYSLGAALGLLVYTVWRRPVLAMIAPLLGGFLVSSGIGVIGGKMYSVVAVLDDGNVAPGANWLPGKDDAWVDAALMLLGNAGFASFAIQMACAVLGVVAHSITGNRWIAMFFLAGGIGIVAFVSVTGFGCELLPFGCPAWLVPEKDWRWCCFGSALWAFIAAGASWRQLGEDMEYKDLRAFPIPPGYVIVSQSPTGGSPQTMLVPGADARRCTTDW